MYIMSIEFKYYSRVDSTCETLGIIQADSIDDAWLMLASKKRLDLSDVKQIYNIKLNKPDEKPNT